MPSNPEIDARLKAQQEAKKHGEPLSFGRSGVNTYRTVPRAQQTINTAGSLVDAEMLFGQQAMALEANLRAMLATLGQLQRARLRAFGADADLSDLDDSDIREQAKAFGVGPDGFIRKTAPDSPSDAQPLETRGDDGHIGR